ncbi:MAG: tetratricopeptide repeat-containing sulfotransferase family protein [Rudaea sp.]
MSAERLWLRAQQYIANGQIAAARISLESLLNREPQRTDARMLLASTILSEGRVREAAAHATVAARYLPDDAGAASTIVHCLLRLGETVAARDCLLGIEAGKIRDGRLLTALAHAWQALGDHPQALTLMDRAKALGFDNPDFRYFRSLQLQFNGRLAEAREELEACLRLGPTYGRASLTLARMRKQTRDSNHLDYIRRQLHSVERGSEDHASFEFAQFKELEDLGDYDEAFAALERGNAVMYARAKHDVSRDQALFDALIRATPAEFVNIAGTGADVDGPMPIFVVGLPRSGTTLLDRILDNHSQVISTGERSEFPRQLRWAADSHGHEMIDPALIERLPGIDFAELGRRYLEQTQWRARGHAFYVDKLPPNFMLIGLIHRALPRAPILHMEREPMDVCYSNYKAMFGDSYAYSYDIPALAAHYTQYRRLMRHWHATLPGRVLDVSYNDLVADPETVATWVFEHCRLTRESGCANLSRNKTAVDTLSSAQVREGIHARALGEWRRYERQLASLWAELEALAKAGQ